VEEVEPEELAVAMRDDGVVVVALEDVQELREDRQVARGVLVPDGAPERLQREQMVEVIGGSQVERLAFLKLGDLAGPPLQGLRERVRSSEAAAELHYGRVHVAGELGNRASHRSSPVSMPAEEHGEARDEI